MRIWLLTSELPHEIAGGIATSVTNIAKLLGAAGHDVLLIARTSDSCDKQFAPGVRLVGIVPGDSPLDNPDLGEYQQECPTSPSIAPRSYAACYPALSYQMAETVLSLLGQLPTPDVIESQEYGALPYYVLQRKLTQQTPLERVPIVVRTCGPHFAISRLNQEHYYRFPYYWLGQMEKFCLAAADALVCSTHHMARWVQQTCKGSYDITVLRNPLVVPDHVAPVAANPGDLLYVGSLQLRKGVLPMIEACGHRWARGENFHLTLIGDDGYITPRSMTLRTFIEQEYARWIEAGNLKLLGRTDHATVLEQMRQAWAVVFPSIWEPFGNVCMEAMGVGQVVLGSRATGAAEMIKTDGENGFLFDWDTPNDFDHKLQRVLTLSQEDRLKIATSAQERIRALWSPELVTSRRAEFYEGLVSRYQARRLFPTVNGIDGDEPLRARERHVVNEPANRGFGEPALLSVVVPYRDLGEHVGETVESVLTTTYRHTDVIVVDDGSTEPKSLEMLAEVERRGGVNVRVVHSEKPGIASARRTGAAASRGEFICLIDCGDLVDPDFFSRAVHVLQRYSNVDFVYAWVKYFGEASGVRPTWNAEFPYLLGQSMVGSCAVVRRASFMRLDHNKPEMEYGYEDTGIWIALATAGGAGVSLPSPLVSHRVRSGPQALYANMILHLRDRIAHQHAAAYRRWGLEMFCLQDANGPAHLWRNPAVDVFPPGSQERIIADLQAQLARFEQAKTAVETKCAVLEDQCATFQHQPVDLSNTHWRVLLHHAVKQFPRLYYVLYSTSRAARRIRGLVRR